MIINLSRQKQIDFSGDFEKLEAQREKLEAAIYGDGKNPGQAPGWEYGEYPPEERKK